MDFYSKLHRKTGIHQVHDQLWNTKNCWCVLVRRCHSPHAHYLDKSPTKGNYKDVTCFSLKLAKQWKNLTIMDFGATSTAKTVSPLLLRQFLLCSLLTWSITLFSDCKWKKHEETISLYWLSVCSLFNNCTLLVLPGTLLFYRTEMLKDTLWRVTDTLWRVTVSNVS